MRMFNGFNECVYVSACAPLRCAALLRFCRELHTQAHPSRHAAPAAPSQAQHSAQLTLCTLLKRCTPARSSSSALTHWLLAMHRQCIVLTRTLLRQARCPGAAPRRAPVVMRRRLLVLGGHHRGDILHLQQRFLHPCRTQRHTARSGHRWRGGRRRCG